MQRHVITALRLSLLLLGSTALAAITPLGPWTTGIATNYGGAADGMDPYSPSFGTAVGSCGYGDISQQAWPYWSVAAVSTSNPLYQTPGQGCGACLEIQCMNSGGQYAGRCGNDGQSIIVQITDSCPECGANQFDIQALTYSKISPQTTGRIDIQYRRVQCVPPSAMSVVVDNNNGPQGWLRLYVTSAGGVGAVSSVQIRTTGTTAWNTLNSVFGSVYEVSNAPSYPLDINIVGSDGQSVSAYNIITSSGQIGSVPAGIQFSIADPSATALLVPTTPAINTPASPSPVPVQSNVSAYVASPSPVIPVNSTNTAPVATVATQSVTSSPASTCSDIPPSSAFTCAQQVGFGQCSQSWMTGFCLQSCGKCTAPASPSPSPTPVVPANTSSPAVNTASISPNVTAPVSPSPVPTSPSPSPAAPAAPSSTCADVQVGSFSCAQQAAWGSCSAAWMTAGNYCQQSCGRCTQSRRLKL